MASHCVQNFARGEWPLAIFLLERKDVTAASGDGMIISFFRFLSIGSAPADGMTRLTAGIRPGPDSMFRCAAMTASSISPNQKCEMICLDLD